MGSVPVTSVIFFSTPRSLCRSVAWGLSWRLLSTDTAGTRTRRSDWPRSAGCPRSGRGTSSGSGRSRCKTCRVEIRYTTVSTSITCSISRNARLDLASLLGVGCCQSQSCPSISILVDDSYVIFEEPYCDSSYGVRQIQYSSSLLPPSWPRLQSLHTKSSNFLASFSVMPTQAPWNQLEHRSHPM